MDARPVTAETIGADVVEIRVGVTRLLLNRVEVAALRHDLDQVAVVLGLPGGRG
ncbi:hypothetical protein [Mycolicibacterium fallax]|uniref:hypothetical protein n=1 Tax=Mycolicibacterium fallax TaxID=1793 RepID=UPI00138BC96F|nr:hypothetical protein [Mycolicibacterium fallax]MCB0929890.1 hypothetical protein [Mycobacterium sp.]BBY99427.1 hypothetical protein MFAL_28940 [Mycolicibacterium fallax]